MLNSANGMLFKAEISTIPLFQIISFILRAFHKRNTFSLGDIYKYRKVLGSEYNKWENDS